jgi:hypothetical protein
MSNVLGIQRFQFWWPEYQKRQTFCGLIYGFIHFVSSFFPKNLSHTYRCTHPKSVFCGIKFKMKRTKTKNKYSHLQSFWLSYTEFLLKLIWILFGKRSTSRCFVSSLHYIGSCLKYVCMTLADIIVYLRPLLNFLLDSLLCSPQQKIWLLHIGKELSKELSKENCLDLVLTRLFDLLIMKTKSKNWEVKMICYVLKQHDSNTNC